MSSRPIWLSFPYFGKVIVIQTHFGLSALKILKVFIVSRNSRSSRAMYKHSKTLFQKNNQQ